MMLDFAMRFWDCILIHPEMYDMFYDYIENQPYERNTMYSIKRNLEDFKYYFRGDTPFEERHRR
jgi:hypothetical protein